MPRGTLISRHSLLSEEEGRLIHEGSCRLLEDTGVELSHTEAVRLFEQAGADLSNGRIRIPASLVNRAVARTAKKISLGARNPDNALELDGRVPRITFGTGGQALYVVRQDEGEFRRRPAETSDLIEILKICEGLDNIDFITRPVEPDVPEDDIDLVKTRLFLEHTTKHMNLANLVKVENLPEILDLAGDSSWISFIACLLVSPLRMAEDTVEKFFRFIRSDLPVSISSCPQGGTTAPLSEIGELVQVHAEVLAAVTLADLIRPGARVFYRSIPITANLYADMSPRWCQPESIRRIAMAADLAHFCGIPCCGTAAVSDEKQPNAQALTEKILGWVFEAASGAAFINSSLGMLEQVMTVSPEQYIIDDMALGRIKSIIANNPDAGPAEWARAAVSEVMDMFGAPPDQAMTEEIDRRIAFVVQGQEEYSRDTVAAQVEAVDAAVVSGRSSGKFMKSARSGLRKGWLYQGERISAPLDLSKVIRRHRRLIENGG